MRQNGQRIAEGTANMASGWRALGRWADWKAASWLLSKGWPKEFGDRIAVESEPASPMQPLTIVLSTPDGKKHETSFKEAEKIFCGDFPIRDTYEPPAEERTSSPAPEPDDDLF